MADPADLPMREAFAQFRSELLADSPGPDLGAVRRIARRRRNSRRTLLSVVTAAALAVPVALYGLVDRDVDPPVQPPPTQPASDAPFPSSSVSPSGPASSAPPVPQRAVTRADITAATLTLPAWPSMPGCPTGRVDVDRPRSEGPRLEVFDVIPLDVDRDGDTEAVAEFWCGHQGGDTQVLAVGRDERGEVVTFGQVVAAGESAPIKSQFGLRADRDGAVGVLVGDRTACCGADHRRIEQQWRSYRWDGQRFVQVGGERQFHPVMPSTDLAVTVEPPVFGAPGGGVRRGTARVTVTNKGPRSAPGIWLQLTISTNAASTGGDKELAAAVRITPACTYQESRSDAGFFFGVQAVCHHGALAAGASRTYTFDVASPVANDSLGPTGLLASVIADPEQPDVRVLQDLNPSDNSAEAPAGRA